MLMRGPKGSLTYLGRGYVAVKSRGVVRALSVCLSCGRAWNCRVAAAWCVFRGVCLLACGRAWNCLVAFFLPPRQTVQPTHNKYIILKKRITYTQPFDNPPGVGPESLITPPPHPLPSSHTLTHIHLIYPSPGVDPEGLAAGPGVRGHGHHAHAPDPPRHPQGGFCGCFCFCGSGGGGGWVCGYHAHAPETRI